MRQCFKHYFVAAKSAISVFSVKSDSGLRTSRPGGGAEDEEQARPRSAAAGGGAGTAAAPASSLPIRRIWFSDSQLGRAEKPDQSDSQASPYTEPIYVLYLQNDIYSL